MSTPIGSGKCIGGFIREVNDAFVAERLFTASKQKHFPQRTRRVPFLVAVPGEAVPSRGMSPLGSLLDRSASCFPAADRAAEGLLRV
ncbi:protein of unknown function [Methylacidimicrobium sp. AP8]|nr:protein of unknown function [Methylacidimicrobium sp. AP8]